MTLNEVVSKLRETKKLYHHVGMSQSYFSGMLVKIEKGLCKPATTAVFLEKFGFFLEKEAEWNMKNNV